MTTSTMEKLSPQDTPQSAPVTHKEVLGRKFWDTFASTPLNEHFENNLSDALQKLAADEVKFFTYQLENCLETLHTRELWDVASLLLGQVSLDAFENFKSFIIAQGYETFFLAVKNPEEFGLCYAEQSLTEMLECPELINLVFAQYEETFGEGTYPSSSVLFKVPEVSSGVGLLPGILPHLKHELEQLQRFGPQPVFTGIHHIQLAVPARSEDLCDKFWGEVLGMERLVKPPALAARGGRWFQAPGVEVHLGVVENFQAATKAHPGFRVRHLNAFASKLTAAGAPVVWDTDFVGMRRFYTEDPFGNRLEFLE